MNAGPLNNEGNLCVGSIFDLDAALSTQSETLNGPGWVFGDTFLVRPISASIFRQVI
jgi:hypothetical protein